MKLTNKVLDAAAMRLLEVKAEIAALEAEAEALTDTLKKGMVQRETETLTGDGWKASWKNVNSKRFDGKSFKADHADLYNDYSKPTVSTRFLVSAVA